MNDYTTEQDIFLEIARERYQNKDKKHTSFTRESNCQTSFDPKNFTNLTEDQILKKLGRKWKTQLCLLGSFFEEYKHITSNYLKDTSHPVSVLQISTTSKNLLSIYKDKMMVSRVLKKLQEIGGLEKVDDYYRFSDYGSVCKRYAYNKHVESAILNLVHVHHINIISSNTHVSLGNTFANDFQIDHEKYYKVRVSSKLKVANITREQAIQILDNKYRTLLEPRLKKVEELNAALPPERKIRLNWNLKFSKTGFLTKVGIRATSQIVSLKEHENENKDYSGKWRRDYLRETGFDKDSFDVHGSIYQITRLLNTGDVLTNDIDPYREMFGHSLTDEERQLVKTMAMPLYFDRPSCILNHMREKIPNTWKKYFGKEGLQSVIDDYCDKMFRYTGKSIDSEVFLHESLLYIDFVYDLWKNHEIECVQVYDGFYFNKRVRYDVLQSSLQSCCSSYHHDYHAFIHVSLGNTFADEKKHTVKKDTKKDTKKARKMKNRFIQQGNTAPKKVVYDDIDYGDDKFIERQKSLIAKYDLNSIVELGRNGCVNHADVQRLLDLLHIDIIKAEPCNLGFATSNDSIAFRKFVAKIEKESIVSKSKAS